MKKTASILFAIFITGALLLPAIAREETPSTPPDSTTLVNTAKKPTATPKKTAAKKKKTKKAAAPAPENNPAKELTKEKITQIAINKAKELGYNMEEMDVFYDEGNQKLKQHLKRSGVKIYDPKTKELKPAPESTPEKKYPELAGKNYQNVYFSRKETEGKIVFGGDLRVFIDKNTGEVITCVGGQ